MKNGEIILCNNIKLDKNYENVLSYSESNMVNLCRQHAIYTGTKYTMMDPSTNEIDIRCPYATCIYSNYIAFNNKNVGNKWYFAFVTDIIYVNPEVTKIRYQVDVFSTWYSRFNINQAFIEREHVEDDTIGSNTTHEGLDTGEFIINEIEYLDELSSGANVVVGLSKLPEELYTSQSLTISTRNYNGIYSGLYYVVCASYLDASKLIAIMDIEGLAENVYSVFLVPQSLYNTTTWSNSFTKHLDVFEVDINVSCILLPNSLTSTLMATESIDINTSLDGYIPKNNKLFTKEFNYMYITNNNGGSVEMAYEDFIENSPEFHIKGSVCDGCSIKLIPDNYKHYDTSLPNYTDYLYDFGLIGAKYPTCSWASDSYTNWLTQQGVNITTEGITGIALGFAINPAAGMAALVSSPVEKMINTMSESKKRETSPIQAKGNINGGDVSFSTSMTCFAVYQMSIKYEFAARIDAYFSRFGYKVNETKTPNLLSRSKFNFIKVGGMDELVTGSIPASDLETINGIFRKGVTIFHNYNDVGNYLVDNPIVE